MSESTKISWADSTASPWFGCTEVSAECAHCYARELTLKRKWAGWGDKSPRVRSKGFWTEIPRWDRKAKAAYVPDYTGRPRVAGPTRPRIFPSLMDWLDPQVPIEWLADFLEVIRTCSRLDFLLLTKRPELWWQRVTESRKAPMAESTYNWSEMWLNGQSPANVWIGVTCGTQAMADERIPELLSIPAKIRWLSVEPILEPIQFTSEHDIGCGLGVGRQCLLHGIDWVVVGGESGAKRREAKGGGWPCTVGAIQNVAIQCKAAGVPVWVKQDCALLPGQQGLIPAEYWNMKELPASGKIIGHETTANTLGV